jgi:endonuclease/exonuclease/phosphatase family metal-dependent hydrolase
LAERCFVKPSYTNRLPLLVRTWNVFHGRTYPPTRRTYLERMIRLVSADGPDIVALQEVPLWALRQLERWSGMTARWAQTMPALLGPLGRLAARLDPTRFRSAATGQANVILVNAHYTVGPHRTLVLNPDLPWRARLLRWEHRRVCQSLEVASPPQDLVVGNLHAAPDREHVRLAADFFAGAERCVLCGDFNLRRFEVAGFSAPIAGLDQILVRGLDFVQPPLAWVEERRRLGDVLLSDHAPVEAVIA